MFDVTKATFKLSGQKFLTKEQIKTFEKFPLYSQDGEVDALVVAKFFIGSITWYVTECNLQDGTMFGLTVGFDSSELGYIPAKDLCEIVVKPTLPDGSVFPIPVGVERDAFFKPKHFSEIEDEKVKNWYEHWIMTNKYYPL